jgi:hypothetical protein
MASAPPHVGPLPRTPEADPRPRTRDVREPTDAIHRIVCAPMKAQMTRRHAVGARIRPRYKPGEQRAAAREPREAATPGCAFVTPRAARTLTTRLLCRAGAPRCWIACATEDAAPLDLHATVRETNRPLTQRRAVPAH